MAYTKSSVANTVWGDKRAIVMNVTADGVSGAVDTGLSYVEAVVGFSPISMATAAIAMRPNLNAASSASNGRVQFGGAVNGDYFTVVAMGR